MAKKQLSEEPIVDIEQAYSKTEQYLIDNKSSITIIFGAIVAIVLGYFAYTKWYMEPRETQAQEVIWVAQKHFEQDSLDLALNGPEGFLTIIEDYSGTKAANLAHYYAGVIYFQKGEYENAIDFMSGFSGKDEMLSSLAYGVIGDAYAELGLIDDAIDYYEKAVKQNENNFTTPILLMKAALAHEKNGNYAKAAKHYEKIFKEYSNSQEGRNAEKYLARAKAKM
jgi:tetratricopeptide (TPR) repeat protein